MAALWITLHHAWYQVELQLHGFVAKALAVLVYGSPAVDLFIVISGFCLMLPVLRADGRSDGAIDFLKRRAWRILPPYYLATIFSLVLIFFFIGKYTGTHWDMSLPVTWRSIATHSLLLHDMFGDFYTINFVFWSISVEWRIYFFFPGLVLLWRYAGPIPATIFGLVFSWLLRFWCVQVMGTSLSFELLGLFATGMLAAAIAFPTSALLSRLNRQSWGWIAILLSVLTALMFPFRKNGIILDYMIGFICGALLILTSINRESWHHRLLTWPPLVFIGTFSYSLYLIHAPLLQMLWQYPFARLQAHPTAMLACLVLPGMPIILGCAYVFFLVGERPFLSRRNPATQEIAAAS